MCACSAAMIDSEVIIITTFRATNSVTLVVNPGIDRSRNKLPTPSA